MRVPRTTILWWLLIPLSGAVALFWHNQQMPSRFVDALTGQGTVWVASDATYDASATTFVPLPSSLVDAPLDTWIEKMQEDGVRGVVVSPLRNKGPGVLSRLQRYESVSPLRAVVIGERAGYYVLDERLNMTDGPIVQSLGRIARQILGGSPPPKDRMFPKVFRKVQSVEVMVLISDQGGERLWRSSRGSTIARALVTACTVARERWHERQQAMGGPLKQLLPKMDVSVSLLLEDGTLLDQGEPFVERVFGPQHGVAYTQPAAWRYLLPEATKERGEGSAVKAYKALFRDNAQPSDSLRRSDFRFYRLRVRELARSKGRAAPTHKDEPKLLKALDAPQLVVD